MKQRSVRLTLVLLVLLTVASVGALLLFPDRSVQQPEHTPYQLLISEICPKNETIIADNGGNYRDYIEIYNAGSEAADLTGFVLTDGRRTSPPMEGILLQPGAYRTVFLGEDLTGFALSASGGDSIQLLDSSGRIVFQTNTSAAGADQVMSLQGSGYLLTDQATPGFSNDARGRTAFLTGSEKQGPVLVISEVLISNVSSLPDGDGIYSDMAELHNTSDQAIYLGDFFLSDRVEDRFRYRLPDSWLEPGGYLLLCCDGESRIDGSGLLHTGFALSHGETLYLTDSTGQHLTLELTYVGDDLSQSLINGGISAAPVSLGFANTEEGIYAFTQSRSDPEAALVISEVLPSSAGAPYEGQLADVVEILNRSGQAVHTGGWYLSDGGDPKAWPLPAQTLEPGQRLVIVCGPETTGFSLSDSESAVLTTPGWRTASRVPCTTASGMSISPCADADGGYCLSEPSPGFSNDETGCAAYQAGTLPALRFSELMSLNASYLKGSYGVTCDWVELYNGSDRAIQLSDYYLTDDAAQLSKFPLPALTLKPGEYCVLLLSDDSTDLLKGYPVIPTALSSAGEQLYLTTGGRLADYVHLPALENDTAWGRDAQGVFTALQTPTPGQPNTDAAPQRCEIPKAVTAQGVYNGVEYIDVVLEGEGTLYYTLGGAAPGEDALRYTGPIRLYESTTVRVVCRQPGMEPSKVLDLTYLINENDTLDAVCLVTDPENLFDYYTGIYVAGAGGENGEYPYFSANYWQDWERPATVSMFPLEGEGFSEGCGIRIHGAFSRAQDKKSLAVLFRGQYGSSSLQYPLFGSEGLDSYESFVLRACGQDASMARMRDELVTSLAADYTDIAVQKYRPVAVYINGEYWGLHYLREKISEHYVAGNYNADPADVTMAELNGEGVPEYQEMIRYVRSHDLNVQEHYDYLCSIVDVAEYADYIIAQICIANTDNDNIKFFKTTEGKWTWILYDTDLAMRTADHDTVAENLNPEGTGYIDFQDTTLINALLEREEFKDWFLRRMAWQINTIWSEQTLTARISQLEQTIRKAVEKDCLRWDESFDRWEDHLADLRYFARNRTEELVDYVQSYFGLSDTQMGEYGFPTPS